VILAAKSDRAYARLRSIHCLSISEARLERVAARQLAVARGAASQGELGARIIGLLDQVWPALRGQGVSTVTTWSCTSAERRCSSSRASRCFAPFVATGRVTPFATPAGEVVTAVHWGPYGEIRDAYEAIERWLAANDRRAAGASWELYGDSSDDPAQLRTDVFFFLGP
jgi:hypothetical protein